MADQPTADELKALKKRIPDLLKQRQTSRAVNGMMPTTHGAPCKVCGKEITQKVFADKTDFCSECKSNFDLGYIAFTCIDGRFAFLKPNSGAEGKFQKVEDVTIELMDLIQKLNEKK